MGILRKTFIISLLVLSNLASKAIWAQDNSAQTKTSTSPMQGKKIELVSGASRLSGDKLTGEEVRTLLKAPLEQLFFKQDFTRLYCDSAVQYLGRNELHAFGNILMVDSDSTVLRGDTLYYDGNLRLARVRGNVTLVDQGKTVTTKFMNYNMNTNIAYYFNGGTVRDDDMSELKSEKGYYNTKTKIVSFKGGVEYVAENTFLASDTLTYHTLSKVVYFNAPTKIRTRDGVVETPGGQYNTDLGTSTLIGRSKIENNEYIISGDTLDYDKVLEKGIAQHNVEVFLKKDEVLIKGDLAKHDGVRGRSDVYGNALMIKPDRESRDTLFLLADTMISISNTDSITTSKKVLAYSRVKMYRKDFQGKCDSLAYLFSDSIIRFYRDPVLWSKGSQMTADSISIIMHNNTIDTMKLFAKSFVIQQDTSLNFNQIKGREITSIFRKNQLFRIDVKGNAESIFHVLEADTALTGLNRTRCGDMILYFSDSGKNVLKEIRFYSQPDSKFIPPQKLASKERYLENFDWRTAEQPTRKSVLGIHTDFAELGEEWSKSIVLSEEDFLVLMKKQKLLLYKKNTDLDDLKKKYTIQVFPVNKNDIPIERRKDGFLDLSQKINEELVLPNRTIKQTVELPNFKTSKIVIGQEKDGNWLLKRVYWFLL